jgi:hypothetical protein
MRRIRIKCFTTRTFARAFRWLFFGALLVFFRTLLFLIQSLDERTSSAYIAHSIVKIQSTYSSAAAFRIHVDSEFHARSHAAIGTIVNHTNLISWIRTEDRKFFEEINITRALSSPPLPKLDIVRLHGKTPLQKNQIWSNTTGQFYLWESNICFAAQEFRKAGSIKKHVLFTYCNENRGALSKDIPDRTAIWDHRKTRWATWGCTEEEVFAYLDHPHTRAVITTQQQSYEHPKAISLPLGAKSNMKWPILQRLKHPPPKDRTQLLMINDNGWRHRKRIADAVNASFGYSLQNTYNSKSIIRNGTYPYLKELQRSIFILAPSGLGYDCYRIWEALYMGAIPIIERPIRPPSLQSFTDRLWNLLRLPPRRTFHDGWLRSLEDLPVVLVDRMETDVTPEFLQEKYAEIVSKANQYKYEKLTFDYWVDLIQSKLLDHVD